MDSILTSTKKLLGIAEEYEHFDMDIIVHINTAFMVLNQLGVGPAEGFAIADKNDTWDEYIADPAKLQAVKSYLPLKVGLLFDPPASSAVKEAKEKCISELEWRLNVAAESS